MVVNLTVIEVEIKRRKSKKEEKLRNVSRETFRLSMGILHSPVS